MVKNDRKINGVWFDMDDTRIYDAVIDTTEGNADYVAKKIYRLAFSTGLCENPNSLAPEGLPDDHFYPTRIEI